MRYLATADTDVGTTKNINQDSILIKHASTKKGEVLLAVICDGMGGLSKGELASATVIRAFSAWFDREMPYELENLDLRVIGCKWEQLLLQLNSDIMVYSQKVGARLGTTFSGILFVDDIYLIVHVGDSRIYYLSSTSTEQLTEDHTFVAREIRRGNMTPEQAKTDSRRNVLLQCIGASQIVAPQVLHGRVKRGIYLVCSDGFRHEISEAELVGTLNASLMTDKARMHENARYLIDLVKSRGERDNISAVLIKAD